MASIAAEVSLHCVICFEEFCTRERPPVVLPCGHTYVCLVCAKRLKKCMECREPLFWYPPSKGPPPVLNMNTRSPAHTRYGRGRYSPGPQTPPHPSYTPPVKEEPVPLPLPKNTVLMDMIESAERQAQVLEDSRKKEAMRSGDKYLVDDEVDSDDEEELNTMLEPTLAGRSAFVGTCGTYAVREPLGLAVLPFDPNKQHQISEKKAETPLHEEKKTEEPREPFTVEAGQTVQVVGVDEGVYKLARGAGYIVATVNQLVKVGGPLEKSCQLEGMLQSVKQEQAQVQKKLDEVNRLVAGLEEKVAIEQGKPEDHPVISKPKEQEGAAPINDENDKLSAFTNPSTPPSTERQDSSSPVIGLHLTASADSTEVELGDPRTPSLSALDHHSNTLMLHSPAHSCPMPNDSRLDQPFMDAHSAGLPRYRVNSDDDLHGLHGLTWGFGCGATLFGERLIEADTDTGNILALSFDDSLVDDNVTIGAQSRAATTVAHTVAGSESSQASVESPLRSGSFDGINFRTGMSGHRGLNQTRVKKSPHSRPNFRLMSEHRGVAAARGAAQGHGHGHLKRRTSPHPHAIGDTS